MLILAYTLQLNSISVDAGIYYYHTIWSLASYNISAYLYLTSAGFKLTAQFIYLEIKPSMQAMLKVWELTERKHANTQICKAWLDRKTEKGWLKEEKKIARETENG